MKLHTLIVINCSFCISIVHGMLPEFSSDMKSVLNIVADNYFNNMTPSNAADGLPLSRIFDTDVRYNKTAHYIVDQVLRQREQLKNEIRAYKEKRSRALSNHIQNEIDMTSRKIDYLIHYFDDQKKNTQASVSDQLDRDDPILKSKNRIAFYISLFNLRDEQDRKKIETMLNEHEYNQVVERQKLLISQPRTVPVE
jgi:hypothetical protein